MKFRPFFLCLIGVTAAAVAAQAQQAQPNVVRRPDGGVGGRMESIFVPPKAGAPFSFTLVTEWSRFMANGGSFTLANERHIVRDSRGRIYQERWILVPKGGSIPSTMDIFQITDPDQHTWYNCVTATKVCDLRKYSLTTKDKFEPAVSTSGPLSDGKGFRQHEDLGAGNTEGVDTHGYKETLHFNPGALGNDQPMDVTREFWFSPKLAINLISIVDDPEVGKQIFKAKDISTAEPDASYFEIPAEYKIVNRLKEPE